ncbi:MAG TPA: M14 family metallopeptidase [Planctomycetota bacterium]|nr:M14 family metallopeptidase [Planctomycetota bacterium]
MGPLTRAERTNYRETSLHSDVIEFIQALKSPALQIQTVGKSHEGRDMPLLVFNAKGIFTPEAAARDKTPAVLIINNIHAGEVEGKEASLMLAREIVEGARSDWIRGMALLILPLFNVDGNERISPRNRALNLAGRDGQIGPEGGVGTRTTGEGINLNRDYMKLEAKEMRLLNEKIFYAWKPTLTVDCHTTDGSIHGFGLTYATGMNPASEAGPIDYVSKRMLPEISRRLFERTQIRTMFYGNWLDENNPSKGWATYSHKPRYGSHYRGLTGMMDVLSETYSYLPFEERVRVNREFLVELLDFCARNIREMSSIVAAARSRTASAPSGQVPIGAELSPTGDEVEIVRRPFSVTIQDEGRTVRYTDFKQGEPEKLRTKYLGRFRPTRFVERPYGYLVPPGHDRVLETLRLHDVHFEMIDSQKLFDGSAFLIEDIQHAIEPDCGDSLRQITIVRGAWQARKIKAEAGTALIPVVQAQGNLIVYLLEPESDDSLTLWGCFDSELRAGKPHPVLRLPRKPLET